MTELPHGTVLHVFLARLRYSECLEAYKTQLLLYGASSITAHVEP